MEDYERILRFRGYKADFSLNVEKILREDRRPGVSRSRRKEERMKQEKNGKRAMTAGLRRTMVIFVLGYAVHRRVLFPGAVDAV